MSVFKCKMCGGTVEFAKGDTVGICDSCGTKQTLPRLDDDKKANLYDRANHFRRNNDFDKAMSIYEQILSEDGTDSEAYWSLVLCRYGIEYVEDPATHKRVPTVNRAQFTSIFDDEDYKSALQYASAAQREVYEQEATAINEIQKGILAISQKEDPFDVFICYKESDSSGRRTPDSVLANDLYHQLTAAGFKVFFARITLEDKLGTAYEPYIFAALNSAKVMVVLGTRAEYFNAVWVKNEWSRYLALVKKSSGKKALIPAYRDMDPYDLPEEFSHLQAQDMSKLGFMQDLIRGIEKIVSANAPSLTAAKANTLNFENTNMAPLLKRAFMFLEDKNWQEADEYCEKVLDMDPECAEAYLGKLMAELQVKKRKQLANCAEPFDDRKNYGKVLRFGNEKLKTEMHGYIAYIKDRNENARLTEIYNDALNVMNAANTEDAYKSTANKFKSISGFKDAAELAEKCREKAEICRKEAMYSSAKSKMSGEKVAHYQKAIQIFKTISGWKDTDEQIIICQRKIEEIKAKEEVELLEAERKAEERRIAAEKAAKKRKKIIAIALPIVCVCVTFIIVLNTVIIPNSNYNSALALYKSGDYDNAITAFQSLNGYKDSERQIENCYIGKYGEKWNEIKNIKVGDLYTFGAYEQDNNTSNGKEKIEWIVLDKEGMSLLLVSNKALDCQQYDTLNKDVTWESCSLRKWMNGTFLNNAFSAEEQAQIQSTTVAADKNPFFDNINPGNATTDKVFLLSITEAEKYFSFAKDRKCIPTAYAIAHGAYVHAKNEGTCRWWLRSPGGTQNYAAYVFIDGSSGCYGSYVAYDAIGVRPALWLDLNTIF